MTTPLNAEGVRGVNLALRGINSGKMHKPSVPMSQKQELEVWMPAPFFCMMMHETAAAKGEGEGSQARFRANPVQWPFLTDVLEGLLLLHQLLHAHLAYLIDQLLLFFLVVADLRKQQILDRLRGS